MLLCYDFLCNFHFVNTHEEGKHEHNTSVYCTLEKEEFYSTPKWLMGRIQMLVFSESFCTGQPANKQISILYIQI